MPLQDMTRVNLIDSASKCAPPKLCSPRDNATEVQIDSIESINSACKQEETANTQNTLQVIAT